MLWLPVDTETVAIDVCYTGSVAMGVCHAKHVHTHIILCMYFCYIRKYIRISTMDVCRTRYLCELLDMYVLCCVCVETIGLSMSFQLDGLYRSTSVELQ